MDYAGKNGRVAFIYWKSHKSDSIIQIKLMVKSSNYAVKFEKGEEMEAEGRKEAAVSFIHSFIQKLSLLLLLLLNWLKALEYVLKPLVEN